MIKGAKWTLCSRSRLRKAVMRRMTMIKKHNWDTMRRKKSFRSCMLGNRTSRTPSWSELQESHKKKSTKCTRGNFTKGAKTKSYSRHPKTTRHTQSNARWANKTKWSFPSSKKPNTIRKPKTTSSRSRSPPLWPWRKSTPAKSSYRPRMKRPSVRDCKGWLMSISSASSSSSMRIIPTCSWLSRFSRRSLGRGLISE